MTSPLLIARRGDLSCLLRPDKANRHGLITGATGTGKTVTSPASACRSSWPTSKAT
jgi:Cdc6-like AAA superfamily ATPase